VTTDITNNLPKVVADHVAACNAHDAEAWMATFAPDAMLNDIQREFIGTDAIRSFGDKEIFGDNVTMEVRRAWIAMATSPSMPRWTEPTTRPAYPTP
jgi:ketosteroid isomerase-like protein